MVLPTRPLAVTTAGATEIETPPSTVAPSSRSMSLARTGCSCPLAVRVRPALPPSRTGPATTGAGQASWADTPPLPSGATRSRRSQGSSTVPDGPPVPVNVRTASTSATSCAGSGRPPARPRLDVSSSQATGSARKDAGSRTGASTAPKPSACRSAPLTGTWLRSASMARRSSAAGATSVTRSRIPAGSGTGSRGTVRTAVPSAARRRRSPATGVADDVSIVTCRATRRLGPVVALDTAIDPLTRPVSSTRRLPARVRPTGSAAPSPRVRNVMAAGDRGASSTTTSRSSPRSMVLPPSRAVTAAIACVLAASLAAPTTEAAWVSAVSTVVRSTVMAPSKATLTMPRAARRSAAARAGPAPGTGPRASMAAPRSTRSSGVRCVARAGSARSITQRVRVRPSTDASWTVMTTPAVPPVPRPAVAVTSTARARRGAVALPSSQLPARSRRTVTTRRGPDRGSGPMPSPRSGAVTVSRSGPKVTPTRTPGVAWGRTASARHPSAVPPLGSLSVCSRAARTPARTA